MNDRRFEVDATPDINEIDREAPATDRPNRIPSLKSFQWDTKKMIVAGALGGSLLFAVLTVAAGVGGNDKMPQIKPKPPAPDVAYDPETVIAPTPDRIKARDSSALPDLVRLAKANGWTSIKINGDADFKRAAYLAAAAQGLTIDGYKPDAKTRAAAARDLARQAGTVVIRPQVREEKQQPPQRTTNQVRNSKEKSDPRLDLAERFRRQSHVENTKDPDLRRAQSHVAHAMSIAASRFPRDEDQQQAFVDRRKDELAGRIERGERIAGVQVRQQQHERIRAIEQSQILQRNRTPSR